MIRTPLAAPPVDDDARYEVVDGVRVEKEKMSSYSDQVAEELHFRMRTFLRDHPIGRATHENIFILDHVRDLQRIPDVAFISAESFPINEPLERDGDWPFAPDIAIEVQSPNDLAGRMRAKISEYFQYDVQQVWLIYPDAQEIVVYRAPHRCEAFGPDDILRSDLLPGFELKVGDIFPPVKKA